MVHHDFWSLKINLSSADISNGLPWAPPRPHQSQVRWGSKDSNGTGPYIYNFKTVQSSYVAQLFLECIFFFFPFLNFIPKVKYSNPSWISVKPTGSIKFPGDWVTWVGLCGYIDHRGPHGLSCMVQDIPEEQWPSIIPRGPRSIQPRHPLPLPP